MLQLINKMEEFSMRYILLTLVFAGIVLMPFAVQAAGEKPVVHFTFDNIKGDTVPDLSGFGNDGILENNPKVVNGQFEKGLEFESSRVSLPASDSFNGDLFREGLFTLVVWVNAKRAGNTWQQIFRSIRADRTNDTLFINNDGRLSWRGHVNAAWAGGMCETAAGVVDADTWTHAAVVSDKKNFRIYVNGELSEESNFQQTDGANVTYFIGGQSGGESYSGAVDDFGIFNVPLKETDIKLIMNEGVIGGTAVELRSKLATQWAVLKGVR